jgi:hypothetical protein
MSNEIKNLMDHVIHLVPLFLSSGLKFVIRPPFLSFLGHNLLTKVYAGYISSSHIYTYLYANVFKIANVYATLYEILYTVSHVHVYG